MESFSEPRLILSLRVPLHTVRQQQKYAPQPTNAHRCPNEAINVEAVEAGEVNIGVDEVVEVCRIHFTIYTIPLFPSISIQSLPSPQQLHIHPCKLKADDGFPQEDTKVAAAHTVLANGPRRKISSI